MKFYFGCGGSISFGVFCVWWVIIHSAEGTSCRNIYFNQAISGKRLVNHVIDTKKANTEDFCQALCYLSDRCVSVNFNQTQDEDGKHFCELNDINEERYPGNLKKEDGFSYRGSKTPCSVSNPCQGRAICQTGSESRCVCPAGFTGDTCNEVAGLSFPTRKVNDFVTCPKCDVHDLQSFTLCFWMRSKELGTMFSYFAKDDDIVLETFREKSDSRSYWALSVNNERLVYPESVTDNAWHHVCSTWNRNGGSWQIYEDGVETGKGQSSTDRVIPGGGVVILGQEQDKQGGRFDISQSFVGSLTLVNLWDHVISSDEISRMSKACTAEWEGNVIKWPDFMSDTAGVRGNVEIISSLSPCQP